MNKKIAVFSTLILFAILITPVFAKEKIEVKAYDHCIAYEEPIYQFSNPNDLRKIWHLVDGEMILTQSDETPIDTFYARYYVTTLKFLTYDPFYLRTIITQFDMEWESNTYADSGFTGHGFFKPDGDGLKTQCLLNGYGVYEGQILKLNSRDECFVYTGLLLI